MRISAPRTPAAAPSVTVVIPCYNYGHYLRAAARSVLEQPGVDARVIIVDDCSPDGSVAVARELAAEDDRVTVIEHDVNRGHIATYNDGLAAVTTRYATLLSADDLLAPGSLARATALMEANPRVGMVYGRPVEFSGEPPLATGRDARAPYTWTVWSGRSWIRVSTFRGRSFILSPEVVLRTSALRDVGPYNAGLPHSGDLEYWLRTAARWDIGRVNGRVQAYYRQHAANMHATTFAGMAADLRHRAQAFDYLAGAEYARFAPDGERLARRARSHMAAEAVSLARHELDGGGDPAVARELFAVAGELAPRTAVRAGRRFGRRLARAESGRAPRTVDTLRLRALHLGDRARWRVWAMTGIS